MPQEIEGIRQIDANELKELIEGREARPNLKLIDVREPHEYNAGHIPGVPLIPMQTIPARIAELNKDDEFVFICRSGARSQEVSKFLKAKGFEKVTNFRGGMLSWGGDIKPGMDE